jgi:hypothetical protein
MQQLMIGRVDFRAPIIDPFADGIGDFDSARPISFRNLW